MVKNSLALRSLSYFKWRILFIRLLSIATYVITVGLYIYFLYTRGKMYNSLIFINLSMTLICYYFSVNTSRVFNVLLMDLLEPKKARNLLNLLFNRRFFNSQQSRSSYNLNMARTYFVQGEFEEAKNYLDLIYPDDFRGKHAITWITGYYFFDYLTMVHTGERPDALSCMDFMMEYSLSDKKQIAFRDKYISYIKAIDKVVVDKESTDLVENLVVEFKIDQLMVDYYSGLNYLNQGKTEEAKACFLQIVDENPDLFYVREAKKYLEELS